MKRGRLSRQGRIFRNFLLAGVLGALIWACAGWPVPARWELRRLEREILLSLLFVFPVYALFLWVFHRVPKKTVL